jgi:hypothetical protein
MVGRMPPTLPLTACAPPCHSLGAQRAYLLPDRRAILLNRRSLAGHAIEPGPLPERLHDDDQVRPDVAAGPARPAPAQRPGSGSERLPEPFADTAGRPDPCPGRVAARRTDALHEVTGADTTDADGDAERADTDAGHPGQ